MKVRTVVDAYGREIRQEALDWCSKHDARWVEDRCDSVNAIEQRMRNGFAHLGGMGAGPCVPGFAVWRDAAIGSIDA